MPSRREQIAMSEQEVAALLASERTITCATIGPRGLPHLMPLWYVVRGTEVWAWTFGRSQKVRNLERDPRATLQVETGGEYQELRGVMLECDVVVHRARAVIAEVGLEVLIRYSGAAREEVEAGARAAVEQQVAKRVALQFIPQRVASFDHRKLGGVY
ncbi:MAG TPA: pyridoxamine 5'-phosphate oxidase family protein [Solirubrobacteraceae bacterium]|nr:pyridoxamine 5'-phosphate oxidase family protein [Solirubrobacteraceae bacterium]